MDVKPMKILIIEDDIDDCNKLINCVKTRNYRFKIDMSQIR